MSARFIGMATVLVVLAVSLGFGDTAAADREPGLQPPVAKMVTLPAEKLPLSKLLADLQRQTAVTVEDRSGDAERELQPGFKEGTFWQALDALANAADARVSISPRTGRITLVKREPEQPRPLVSHSGLFRLALKRVLMSEDLETGHHACTASLEVAWEPQLQPYYLETYPKSLKVRDGEGKDVPFNSTGSSPAPVDGRTALTFDFALPALPRGVKHLGLVQGNLSAVAPNKMLTFTFGTLDRLARAEADNAERRLSQEGVTCTIRKVALTSERWSVQVALDYPPGGTQLESYQSWVVNNEMTLESLDQKKRLPSGGYVLESSSPRHAVLTYHFLDKDRLTRGGAEDWKISYRAPGGLVTIPISFAFKDVPLP
jgi:hypothetical protein